jgi:hypothetical protein
LSSASRASRSSSASASCSTWALEAGELGAEGGVALEVEVARGVEIALDLHGGLGASGECGLGVAALAVGVAGAGLGASEGAAQRGHVLDLGGEERHRVRLFGEFGLQLLGDVGGGGGGDERRLRRVEPLGEAARLCAQRRVFGDERRGVFVSHACRFARRVDNGARVGVALRRRFECGVRRVQRGDQFGDNGNVRCRFVEVCGEAEHAQIVFEVFKVHSQSSVVSRLGC